MVFVDSNRERAVHLLKNNVLAVVAIVGSLASGIAAALPTYTLTILPSNYVADELRVTESGVPYLAPLPLTSVGGFYGQAFNVAGQYAGVCLGGFGAADDGACTYSATDGILGVAFDRPDNTTQQAYSTQAYDVNDQGDVLGSAYHLNTGSPLDLQIRLAGGGLVTLTGLSSYRRPSFNEAYEIVGAGIVGQSFYFADAVRTPLEDLVRDRGNFQIRVPTDISNSGFIVGYGIDGVDEVGRPFVRGFLLTPAAQTVAEPQSLALGLLALAYIGVTQRRSAPARE